MLWILLILIVFLIFSGLPLFVGLGSLAVVLTYFKSGSDSLINLFLDPLGRLTQNDMLLPIPYFTLMGYIVARSRAPDRLVTIFQQITLKIIGKRAFTFGVMAVVVSAFFTPYTGASGVTIIALGGILLPVLRRARYPESLSLGIITTSGSLGLLFFPSIPVILYGIISNNKVSITDLFKAGILPGILLMLIPSLYIIFTARKIQVEEIHLERSVIVKMLKRLIPELMILPVLFVLFMTGKAAVSEIGLVALLYFFILEVIVFKEIPFSKLKEIVIESMTTVGGILIIIFFATAFTSFMIDREVPQNLFVWIQKYIHSRWTFLILLNLFLLLVGAFMDIFSAIIVTAPLVIPIAEMYNVNMIHLGVLFLTNLEIGYITPPVGMNLFLSAFRFKIPMTQIYRSVWPFLLCLIFAQIVITYVPDLSLFIMR